MDELFSQKYNQFKMDVMNCSCCGELEHTDEFFVTNEVKLLILSATPFEPNSKAKELLINLLDAHGFNKNDYAISSVVKCFCSKPSMEVCKKCRSHLATEFKLLRPGIIVLLGAGSYEAFFGKHPDGNKVRGVISEVNGFKIMTTCNPQICLENLGLKMLLYEDMGTIKALM